MELFVKLLFIFFAGSLIGWCIELVFRKFFSGSNPEHKWINPGFLVGPYLPLYGFGLTALYLMASVEIPIGNAVVRNIVLIILMMLAMTLIEYIAGLIFIKGLKVKLWDYSDQPGNIQGIICPLFSFFWAVLGAVYIYLVHPHILEALTWLANNLTFCLVIGFFYGVFVIDVFYSLNLVAKVKKFAKENEVVVRYEGLKASIRKGAEERAEKIHFMFPFTTPNVPLREQLERYVELSETFYQEELEKRIQKKKKDA